MDDVEKQRSPKNFFKMAQTLQVDVEFQNLIYSLPGKECKQLLKSISGKFNSGELNAILGPSGSGKTILLKVLAGYLLNGMKGVININGRPRQMKSFHKISTYIMQEDLLQPHLTLNESIIAAARLRLGDNISLQEKHVVVEEVLNVLGLENCLETRMENLSGGERKRLSIALEMVSNPPIIFLDEPTSGLDTVAIKQCVNVLKKLTDQGKTVICTAHQPSATTFQQFDQVYFISNGTCVYNGSTSNMIPFLSSVGLECPITYSPAEFIIETVQTNEEHVPALVAAIQNGKINRRDPKVSNHFNKILSNRLTCADAIYEESRHVLTNEQNFDFPVSFWVQFCVVFGRMMLQLRRNKLAIWIQLFHHSFVGIFLGALFFGIGNDAEMALANFKYSMFTIFFFMYTYMVTLVLLFPAEVKLLKREYFNRWYGLKPYFLALTLRNMPVVILLGLIFILVTYLMTNQPMELDRFIGFTSVCFLAAFVCESLGLAIGSVCTITNGSIVALTVNAPGAFLCIYGMGYGNTIGPVMKTVMSTNYARCALVAICLAVFKNRPSFECNEIYCRYKNPEHLLRDLGMSDASYSLHILILVFFFLLFRLIAFLALRCRLSPEFSQRVVNMKRRTEQWKN